MPVISRAPLTTQEPALKALTGWGSQLQVLRIQLQRRYFLLIHHLNAWQRILKSVRAPLEAAISHRDSAYPGIEQLTSIVIVAVRKQRESAWAAFNEPMEGQVTC